MNISRSGTAPHQVRRADLLPIESGEPMPEMRHGLVRDTLNAMKPGDSILVRGSQLSNVYKWAQRNRFKVRVKRLSGAARAPDSRYRIWRAT